MKGGCKDIICINVLSIGTPFHAGWCGACGLRRCSRPYRYPARPGFRVLGLREKSFFWGGNYDIVVQIYYTIIRIRQAAEYAHPYTAVGPAYGLPYTSKAVYTDVRIRRLYLYTDFRIQVRQSIRKSVYERYICIRTSVYK